MRELVLGVQEHRLAELCDRPIPLAFIYKPTALLTVRQNEDDMAKLTL
jgi:hypothetical protein